MDLCAFVLRRTSRIDIIFDALMLCNRAAETSQSVLEAAFEDGLAGFWEPFPSYGTAYVYDTNRLARQIGPEFARELKSVQQLLASMRCRLVFAIPFTLVALLHNTNVRTAKERSWTVP